MSTGFQLRFRDDKGRPLTLSGAEKDAITEKLRDLLDALNAELETNVRYRVTTDEGDAS